MPLASGETVDDPRFQQQLAKLNGAVRQKCPEDQQRRQKLILLDENDPAHRIKATRELVASYSWESLAHADYSPDMEPTGYHLFASKGNALSEQHFSSSENMKKLVDDWFKAKQECFGVASTICHKDE